jgi:hypothetical protein
VVEKAAFAGVVILKKRFAESAEDFAGDVRCKDTIAAELQ